LHQINHQPRSAIKIPPYGVTTVSENRFNNKIEEVNNKYRHWLMQDKALEDNARLELVNFRVSKLVWEFTFIFRTTDKKNRNEGALGWL